MKYLRLRLRHDGETVHPMHAFEMRHDRIERAELLHRNAVLDETNAQVFRVRGDPDVFRAKLSTRDATVAYGVTEAVGEAFRRALATGSRRPTAGISTPSAGARSS